MGETAQLDRRGKYLLANHFFSGDCRGTFAAYSRLRTGDEGEGVKVCVRVELLPVKDGARRQYGTDPITLELKLQDVQRLLVVIAGKAPAHEVRVPRPSRPVKVLRMYRNEGEENLVMVLMEGGRVFTGTFGPEGAFWFGLAAMKVLEATSGGLPITAVWDAFTRVLAIPTPPKDCEPRQTDG